LEIERVSDNQIKFILSKNDLLERDINIGELAYGSEKTQELFREMMLQALVEYDFQTENTPLMIEAIPLSQESIIIVVTKVTSADEIEDKFNFLRGAREVQTIQRPRRKGKNFHRHKSNLQSDHILIYSFDSLDTLTALSVRLSDSFLGESVVYKYQSRYYLVLEKDNAIQQNINPDIEGVLSEYGQKHVSTVISKHFLIEHGEIIIKSNAIGLLTEYLS